jgi:hypothetical protein
MKPETVTWSDLRSFRRRRTARTVGMWLLAACLGLGLGSLYAQDGGASWKNGRWQQHRTTALAPADFVPLIWVRPVPQVPPLVVRLPHPWRRFP